MRYKALASLGGLLLVVTAQVFGDGGSVLFRKQSGSLVISVFSASVPVRVGAADFSVMVQRAGDPAAVLDADVKVHLFKSTRDNVLEIMMPATRAKSTNKMMYAAQLKVPSSGDWRLTVNVSAQGQAVEVSSTINVLPEEPPVMARWPYFALIPAVILAYALNQWLKSKRGISRS